MSWLSKATGIGISPKGIKIDPKKALLTAGLGIATGGLGLLGGGLKVGGYGLGTLAKGSALMAKDKLAGIGLGKLATAGKFLAKHKDTIADYGGMAEGIYDRVQENKAAGEMQDRYRSLQPLRDQAMRDLTTPAPSVSGMFSEPEQRYRRVNVGSRGY
jgi:hypothetical protein